MTRMAVRGQASAFQLIVNGSEVPCDDWTVDVVREAVNVTPIGSPYLQHAPGGQTVTVTVTTPVPAVPAPPAYEPTVDLVTHVATRCCCGGCPKGGDHEQG